MDDIAEVGITLELEVSDSSVGCEEAEKKWSTIGPCLCCSATCADEMILLLQSYSWETLLQGGNLAAELACPCVLVPDDEPLEFAILARSLSVGVYPSALSGTW